MTSPGLVIAAPASGSGKTIVTLALLRAYRRAGVAVGSAKAGPDYIDPAFHTAASGVNCVNLDCWGMRPRILSALAGGLASNAELILCEGVMGLFDGAVDGTGTTADLAVATGWPVILVLDVRGQAASAAVVYDGFARHCDGVNVVGAICNRVGGPGHERTLREAFAALATPPKFLGFLPRDPAFNLPERHLGLVQAQEHDALEAFLDRAADLMAERLDLSAIRACARLGLCRLDRVLLTPPLGQHIAVARDEAFAFAYSAVLEGWREAGATLSFFSPLADEAPVDDADGVYLPGGYPELHAGRLAANAQFRDGLTAAAARGASVYGECGGYMALGAGLVDTDGIRHAMTGLLPLETSFAKRRLHLGYRFLETSTDSALGAARSRFRGHEFHYATLVKEGPGAPLFRSTDARGENDTICGLVSGTVAGSFLHLIDCAP